MFETPTPVSAPETSPAPQPFAERLSDQLQHILQVIVGSQLPVYFEMALEVHHLYRE